MKINILWLVVIGFCLFARPVFSGDIVKSTLNDQTGIEVTVYNSNLGLVKDTRKINLPSGNGELRFMDVAAYIMPVTVHAKSVNHTADFSVLEQNYEYDLINESKLLDKYVGKTVKLMNWNQYSDKKETVEATLLSNNGGQVYKINNEIYLGYPGMKILPEIPENLIAQPTLTWLYNNAGKDAHSLEVSYLTSGITWNADYVLIINKADNAADISGWVTVDNKSGATYKDAILKLVAGDVNRVQPTRDVYAKTNMLMMESAAGAPQFAEKAFFEYHIYDLQRKTTIKDNQTKQISLLEADNFKIQKEFITTAASPYYNYSMAGQKPKQTVHVMVSFKNSKDNKLGMPLPAGTMRLYKQDDEEKLQFIGEDRIDHTPEDEDIRLKIGDAFDVVAERVQTDFRQISSTVFESEWEVALRNHKNEDINVGVVEPLAGCANWEVITSSHTYTKMDAFTIRFDVKVSKDQEVRVKYRLRVGY